MGTRKHEIIAQFQNELMNQIRYVHAEDFHDEAFHYCLENGYEVLSIILISSFVADHEFQMLYNGWMALLGYNGLRRAKIEETERLRNTITHNQGGFEHGFVN